MCPTIAPVLKTIQNNQKIEITKEEELVSENIRLLGSILTSRKHLETPINLDDFLAARKEVTQVQKDDNVRISIELDYFIYFWKCIPLQTDWIRCLSE
jgi:hypothetical protein